MFPLSAVAAAAAVSQQDLCNALRGLRSRGRCGTVASEAFINGTAANRAAASGSLSCPAGLVRLGAADVSDAVRSATTGAPGWSADAPGWNGRPLLSTTPRARVVAAALSGPDGRVEAALVSSCPSALATALAADPDAGIRACVAKNSACPPHASMLLAGDEDSEVVDAVAQRHDLTSSVLTVLAVNAVSADTADRIIANADCDAAVVAAMADNSNHWMRSRAARHRLCALSTLRTLAGDNNASVRGAAAENPNCGSDLLAQLAADDDWNVRAAVASNSNCAPETLRALSRDDETEIVEAVARHSKRDASVVAALAYNSDWFIREDAARDPLCDPATLRMLADDPDPRVRFAVGDLYT